jgi:hypothetical protein
MELKFRTDILDIATASFRGQVQVKFWYIQPKWEHFKRVERVA